MAQAITRDIRQLPVEHHSRVSLSFLTTEARFLYDSSTLYSSSTLYASSTLKMTLEVGE